MSPDFQVPTYSTPGSAAFDIRSPIDFTCVSGTTVNLDLGFAAEVPEGHVAVICPRSGLGTNHGLGLRNTVGVIDSDYRGEWEATVSVDTLYAVYFDGGEYRARQVTVNKGDRILQCMIIPVQQVDFVITDTLSETERGSGGYGSTGIK